ncbi:MAG TPA: hypothetical protein DIW64_14255 [Cellvibrio sp.]|nr:hypothetical protein [Cellvibrio sp.]
MNVASSRLWLAIRFSDLPLTALKLDDSVEKPIVVIQKKRVIFANALAEEAGARVGMDITTAQLLSGCEVVERDEAKEQSALSELSEQFYHFSPYIDRYRSDELAQSGLLLEISSCLKLFGGLNALSEIVFTHLAQTLYGFEYGLAHSAKAAWYLSFDHYEIVGNETKSLFIERLNTLSIDLLFDYPKAVDALSKTGFKTFGDLAKQIEGKSISSFKKRLGAAFTDVLCEIYDIDQNFQQSSLFEKPRDIYRPVEWFEEEIQFDYPVTNVEQLKPALESLLQDLSNYLRKRQQQCQYIEWCISDIYRKKEFVKVNSDEPQSHWQLLYDLSLIQFDNKELPFEVDTVKLTCHHVMPLQTKSQVLDFDQSRRRKSVNDFTITIAKLKARLGDSAVYKLGYRDSRVPEITNAMVALADRCNQELPDIHLKALRPTWLLTQPELIDVKGNRLYWHGYLTTLVGPERVIGEWWEKPVARDYFLAKRHDSLPVWIFFDLYDKQWYIHGVFA